MCLLTSFSSRGVIGQPLQDTPFQQEYSEHFTADTAESSDVRKLAIDGGGNVWAATGAGVRVLSAGAWHKPDGADIGPAYSICSDSAGHIWVGAWNGAYRVVDGKIATSAIKGVPISVVRSAGNSGAIIAAGPHGISILNGAGAIERELHGAWQTAIRDVLPESGNRLWIATASGLYLQGPSSLPGVIYSRPFEVISSNINALCRLQNGTMAVATTGGVDLFTNLHRTRSLSGKFGIPYRNALSLTTDKSGRIWCATHGGAERFEEGVWKLRASRRWLLSDEVRDIAIGSDGTAWVATNSGVSAIRSRRMTLKQKAEYLLDGLRARHLREPGLVGPAVLVTPGDLTKSFIEDDDNDGEHTGMYLGMESMRFAVTHDASARANAKVAFHGLMALQRVTGTRHFFARSMLPLNPPIAPRHEVDRTFTQQEIAELARTDPREKIIERRWVPSTDGNWMWKRDASSDEVDGHLFGYCTYFDLAADEDEKLLVADQVDRIVGGIVDHGYTLADIDGKPTRWGNWSPQSLNSDPNWHEERPGNSVEMLEYLGVAYHMTHKSRYVDAARELVAKYGYGRNIAQTTFDTPSERTHIEDELLSIVYPNMLAHLILPEIRANTLLGLERWHRSNARDHIPFYDFVYCHCSGKSLPLEDDLEMLREWPLSHIEWTVDNSRREDVKPDLTPGLDPGFLTRMLPRTEMGLCMWDQEPYKAVIGNNGSREDRQNDWLLAYWMGRYFGLIGE